MVSLRSLLRNSIERKIVSEFVSKGFVRGPLSDDPEINNSRELRAIYPFGRLRRMRGNNVEVVEIQFEKRGRAAFRLEMGIIPMDGTVSRYNGKGSLEYADLSDLPKYYTLYRCPLFLMWFSVKTLWRRHPSKDEVEHVVDKVLEFMPDIMLYFDTGRPGRNMRAHSGQL